MTVATARRLFTVDDYYRMLEAGILNEGDRVELIDGEIVEMTPISAGHAACVDRLAKYFVLRVQDAAIVRVQGPVRLSHRSEPQPDIAVLRALGDFYADEHPSPTDVLLVIEVAETSETYDRQVKMPLYARAGIQESWLVVPSERRIEVFRQPTAEGYQQIHVARAGQALSPQALPGVNLTVEEILGE